jgi:hypothetical protein
MNNEILFIALTVLMFLLGILFSSNNKYKNKIIELENEIEGRKVFLDKVFHLIELNESVDIKIYFNQALDELKKEKEINF